MSMKIIENPHVKQQLKYFTLATMAQERIKRFSWFPDDTNGRAPQGSQPNLVKVHLSHSTQRAINMLNKYLNKYRILCRDCKPCSIHWHVTCVSQNIRNWIEIRWPGVCSNVSAFVEAFRTSQSLPVQATTAVPKIHVVFQSQWLRAPIDLSLAWHPLEATRPALKCQREAGFNMRFIQKLCLKVSYWIGR